MEVKNRNNITPIVFPSAAIINIEIKYSVVNEIHKKTMSNRPTPIVFNQTYKNFLNWAIINIPRQLFYLLSSSTINALSSAVKLTEIPLVAYAADFVDRRLIVLTAFESLYVP